MNQLSKLITFGSLIFSNLFVSSAATAFSLSLEEQIGNDYTYTVNLDADDSLAVGDKLILTNLSGVTAADAASPYSIGVGDFNDISANFTVEVATDGAVTLTGAITLTSANSLDDLEYLAFYQDNATPRFASGGDVSTSVPFDFSPSWGIVSVLSLWGLQQLKRKLN